MSAFQLIKIVLLLILLSVASFAQAQNIPGGGTGTGANVTVTDNGGSVVLDNSIVSISINKTSATINNYTYKGINLFAGGHGGGSFYWSWNMPAFGGPNGNYTLTVNPASNGGNYAEVHIHSPWSGNAADAAMDVDIYYSLTRGAQGYYVTATLSHPSSYPNNPGGEWRCNTYIGSIFDWLSVDTLRNRMMASPADGAASTPVAGAPKEVWQLNTGIYSGQTECKYAYSADLGDLNVWGWTSTSKKVGIWMTVPSHEYYNGGPMKRELTGHNGHTLLNMLNGEHYAMGNKYDMASGQASQKTFGPFLVYANSYVGAASDPAATVANALWKDAQSQALAEQSAWPYTWFKNPAYIQESGRGTVTGTLKITDNTDPGASAAGMWIGLAPNDGGTDFQYQASTYQFWVKTDANGNFKIPHVIAGTYNLWAFGPGAAGTFKQTNITVVAGQTLNMNTVSWTPTRVGPTVWEIGIPDRDTKEFKNGHPAQIVAGVLPPYAVWGTFQQPTDNLTYTIGQSNWATDWNYVQYTPNANVTWKIKFDLAKAPTAGSQAAIYLAFAADFGGTVAATVNGTSISAGFSPTQQADAMVRLGSHGAFGDTRITFAGSLLKAGANEIDLTMRRSGGDAMYDYLRLEATGVTTSINQSPIVNLTPITGIFCMGSTVTINANANDTDGTINNVQFFNGTTLLGSDATAPYSFSWTNVGAGNYSITAIATDNGGATTTSSAISITVNPLPSMPTVTSPLSYCQNAPASALTATGTGLKWYTAATGGTGSTTAPTPITTTVATTNYYVSQTMNTCESARALIALTINALPIATITTPATSFCAGGSVVLTSSTGATYKWFNGTTQVGTAETYTATAAGAYTVEVTNSSGCKSTSAVTQITVNALPTATIIAPATSFCTGGSVVLTASAGASYKWFNGTTQVGTAATYTTTAAGAYTVEVTNSSGCKATSAVTTIIVAAASAPATITTPATSFCAGGSVILSANTGVSYKWFNGTTLVGTSSAYTATAAGSYTVEVTNNSGCKATSTATQIFIAPTVTWYADLDNDGIGDAANTINSCTKPNGYVATAGDACPTDANKTAAGNCGCGNTETSCLDCSGTPNGTAFLDNCNICVGGTTGNTACLSTATINGTNASIKVIPQPFDANTSITIDKLGMIQSYTIISSSGALVETRQGLNTEEITIGETIASGLYTVILTTEKGIYTTKIVKK